MSLPADILSSASTLIRVMADNGCAVGASTVSDFQTAFNANYSPAITVDGKYGPQTQGALDQVIADATPPDQGVYNMGTAPPACSYAPRTPSGAPSVPSSPSHPSPAPAPMQASTGLFSSPWTWALIAAGAAAVAISRSKHPPAWARKLGLHR